MARIARKSEKPSNPSRHLYSTTKLEHLTPEYDPIVTSKMTDPWHIGFSSAKSRMLRDRTEHEEVHQFGEGADDGLWGKARYVIDRSSCI